MRKVFLIGLFAYAVGGYASQKAMPVRPTSQFSPVVLQEDYYVPSRVNLAGLADLYSSLQRVAGYKNVRVTVVHNHNRESVTQAEAVQRYLLGLGMGKGQVSLIQQPYPLYPLYVIVQSLGKVGVSCHFKDIDSGKDGLQDVTPCYLENNRHIQTVF